MRKAEITVHLFQEIRHIMLGRPAKNLNRYEFCVCCGGITPYQVDTPVWMRKTTLRGADNCADIAILKSQQV